MKLDQLLFLNFIYLFNITEVRNMKQYLLTVLFNAPTTISNHYTSQVNHDMNAGGW